MIYIRLKELMAEKDCQLSLRKLADDLKENRDTVRRLAANEYLRLPVDLLDKICVYFDCEIGDLIVHMKGKTGNVHE